MQTIGWTFDLTVTNMLQNVYIHYINIHTYTWWWVKSHRKQCPSDAHLSLEVSFESFEWVMRVYGFAACVWLSATESWKHGQLLKIIVIIFSNDSVFGPHKRSIKPRFGPLLESPKAFKFGQKPSTFSISPPPFLSHHPHPPWYYQNLRIIISMAFLFNTSNFLLLLIITSLSFFSCIPFVYSLSTVSISENPNQTLICALIKTPNQQAFHLNCTSFPQGIQIPVNPNSSFSGIVAGSRFVCVLTQQSSSILLCWRFSTINGNGMSYKRIYCGPALKNLDAGNSHICGIVNKTNRLEC